MSTKLKKKPARTGAYKRFVSERQIANAEERYMAFEEVIRSIPVGKIATYGQVAGAAGYPRAHRLVARFLSTMCYSDIPWQRVVGAGGEIKICGEGAVRQRLLLKAEGVNCSGKRIDIRRHQHIFE